LLQALTLLCYRSKTRNQVYPLGNGGSNPSLSAKYFFFIFSGLPLIIGFQSKACPIKVKFVLA
jgi:hypothetical protein